MKIENQVCSLEQSKKFAEVGILQDSLFYYFPNPNTEIIKKKCNLPDYNLLPGSHRLPNQEKTIREFVLDGSYAKTYSAYTVAELFVMIGINYVCSGVDSSKIWLSSITELKSPNNLNLVAQAHGVPIYATGKNQAESLASLLILNIDRSLLINPEDINKNMSSPRYN